VALLFFGNPQVVMRVGMGRIELQGTLIRVDCPREISDLAKNISQVSIG
jgi:hypothetical protein